MHSPNLSQTDTEDLYFDLLAEMNFTKHIGGQHATDELLAACHIDAAQHVLDVGCGVGVTPVHIAKKYGSRVTGVDIREKMIERANERVAEAGLSDRVKFRLADAQDLPFEDDTFDAVICESVLAFMRDKQQTVQEYLRVTKPGGYVGITEAVWMKTPSPELRAAAMRSFGGQIELLAPEEWPPLLKEAGLREVQGGAYPISIGKETMGRVRRIGCGHMIAMWGKALKMVFARADYRRFIKLAMSEPKELLWYWGYGVWVGRK